MRFALDFARVVVAVDALFFVIFATFLTFDLGFAAVFFDCVLGYIIVKNQVIKHVQINKPLK